MKILEKKDYLPFLILALFGLVIFFMGIMNHYFFRSYVFDYGNYNYAFRDYAHFRISPMPTYPGNFLQDHFSFLLMYFIPVYWLLNWLTGTYTLIIIQNALILTAAWYSYKLIRLKTRNFWLGVGVLLYYFLLLGRWSTFACDVNLAVMSACLIPIFLYYFELRKYITSFIILVLSLLARENIPLWFIFIFIVLIIEHRKDRNAVLFSIMGIVVSLAYFMVLFKVLIPAVETEEKAYTLFNYSALGENPAEAFLFVLKNPVESIKMFFVNHLDNPAYDGIKTEFYLVYLFSGAFILLYRPQYLIWFIPIVAQKVLNDHTIRWGILTYYSIEVVTLLPVSVFLVIASIKRIRLQNIFTIIVCAGALSVTIYKFDRNNRVVPSSYRADKENIFYKKFYESNYNIKETHRLLEKIPGDARVSASENFFSHLSQRDHIYFFPTVKDAEYMVFSVYDDYWRKSHMQNEYVRNAYLRDPDWEIIEEEFPVFLLRKKDSPAMDDLQHYSFRFITDTLFCDFEHADTLNKNLLFDNGKPVESTDKLSSDRSHSGDNSIILKGDRRFGKRIRFKAMDSFGYLTATVWFYGNKKAAYIVSNYTNSFYFSSNTIIEEEESGWRKIKLSLWTPPMEENKEFDLYLYNSSKDEQVYFDDLRIVRKIRKIKKPKKVINPK